MKSEDVDLFMKHYLMAMWFTDCPEDAQNLERPPMSEEMTVQVLRDCGNFLALSKGHVSAPSIEQAAHDFWLTRNGHGAGFWDGDWESPAAEQLTELSQLFGAVETYVGDDGLLYQMGGNELWNP